MKTKRETITRGARIINPVAAAMYVHRWRTDRVEAEIHALMGDDGLRLVNGAGRVFFVVLTAAAGAGMHDENQDMRIIRGAIEALHAQAENEQVNELHRAGIMSGLAACRRILPHLKQRDMADAALYMDARLKMGDVRYSDFQALIETIQTH